MLSECCDAPPWGDIEETGICGFCKEHCEFYDEDEEEEMNEVQFELWKETRGGYGGWTLVEVAVCVTIPLVILAWCYLLYRIFRLL